MSAAYNTEYYEGAGAVPLPVPHGKGQGGLGFYGGASGVAGAYGVSPPEDADTSSSASGIGSYSSPSAVGTYPASSYAGSTAGEYDNSSSVSAGGVDFQDYMQERFAGQFNPIPLDRSVAVQAQTSGKLNAKHREVLDMQKQAQARLAKLRGRFQDGMADARELRADLDWTQKKMNQLKTKAASKHSKEFQKARARFPSPEYN